jgi:uncharacterized delta-60 repeat protein
MEGAGEQSGCRWAVALTALALLLVPAGGAQAATGLPDPSFGTGGFTVLDDTAATNENLSDVAVLGSGKILGVGRRGLAAGFLLARFNANGSPDGSFGSGGIQVQPDTGAPGAPRSIDGLDVQADGRIVVGGLGRGAAFNALAFGRYLPDGTPDTSFGDGAGIKVITLGGPADIHAVAVAPDGSIVGVGSAGNNVLVARLTSAGQPDPSFGPGGVRTVDVPGSTVEQGQAVEVLPDGSVVVAGPQGNGGFLAKLDAAGNLVAGFGTNGIASNQFGAAPGETASVEDIKLRDNGSILAVGTSNLPASDDSQLFAARFTSAGALDPGFASSGLFLSNPTQLADAAHALELVENRVLLAGERGAIDEVGDAWLLRLTENGALDPTFGTGGETIASIGAGREAAFGLALQPDGKPVIAGVAVRTAPTELLVGRFTADERCKDKLPTILGTPGPDTIVGTDGADVVLSLAGNDKVNTGKGNDLICLGDGKDRASGGTGDDKVQGDAGKDVAGEGGAGKDKLKGGPGRDKLVGGAGNDRLFGGKGNRDRCIGGAGKHDRAAGCERLKKIP